MFVHTDLSDFYARVFQMHSANAKATKGWKTEINKLSHLQILQAVMSQVHPERTVPESSSTFPETVQQPRDSWVLPSGVEAQSPVRL